MYEKWFTFYMTLGAAAEMAALNFIAIGTSFREWTNHAIHRISGLRTFADFVLPFFFSMILMPGFVFRIAAIIVAGLGS